jgi:hypothetical protein
MKHLDKLDFAMIAVYQKYSLDFIKNNLDKFNLVMCDITNNGDMSEKKLKDINDILEQYSDMM